MISKLAKNKCHFIVLMIPLATKYKAIVHYTYFLRSLRKVSKIHGVSKSSLQRWVQQEKPELRHTRSRKKVRRDVSNCIEKAFCDNPFLTLDAIADSCAKECGLVRTKRTMGRYVKQEGWTNKKACRIIDCKHDNDHVKAFCDQFNLASDGPICIDEAGFYVGDHPRRGWSKRGTRLKITSGKSLRRSKLTIIMAISAKGIVHYEILDHNCKKVDFVAFIERMNAPAGSTLVMDNIRFHKSKETRDAMALKGFKPLFIPTYSPKMNAIENVFGALKPLYRRRCPPVFASGFDYKHMLQNMLQEWTTRDLSAFFEKTKRIVAETLDGIRADPTHFAFCGYD